MAEYGVFSKQKEIKNEGQHLPQTDDQACPHACIFLFNLQSPDVDPIPDPETSCCDVYNRESMSLPCSSL